MSANEFAALTVAERVAQCEAGLARDRRQMTRGRYYRRVSDSGESCDVLNPAGRRVAVCGESEDASTICLARNRFPVVLDVAEELLAIARAAYRKGRGYIGQTVENGIAAETMGDQPLLLAARLLGIVEGA